MKIELNHPITMYIIVIFMFIFMLLGAALFSSGEYKSIVVSKMPKNMVKSTIKDMQCNDTCWTHEMNIDNEYKVWLNPSTAVHPCFEPYFPIKIIKMLDSSFTVDLLKCKDDYDWIKCNECDYEYSGHYHVKQIICKERLKK